MDGAENGAWNAAGGSVSHGVRLGGGGFFFKIQKGKSDMVVHDCNPSVLAADGGHEFRASLGYFSKP